MKGYRTTGAAAFGVAILVGGADVLVGGEGLGIRAVSGCCEAVAAERCLALLFLLWEWRFPLPLGDLSDIQHLLLS